MDTLLSEDEFVVLYDKCNEDYMLTQPMLQKFLEAQECKVKRLIADALENIDNWSALHQLFYELRREATPTDTSRKVVPHD